MRIKELEMVVPQNDQETELITTLYEMLEKNTRIEISLRPGLGNDRIKPNTVNMCVINEGRNGKFTEISEKFYDYCALKFDSRCIDSK